MPKRKKADQPRKMSEIMLEMSDCRMRDPEAIRFLRETRKMSRDQARMKVAKIRTELGMW